jgi:hypothetical protein
MGRNHFPSLSHVLIRCLRRHSRSFISSLFCVPLSSCRAGRPWSLESTHHSTRSGGCLDSWFYSARHLEYRQHPTFCGEQNWYPPSGISRRRHPRRKPGYLSVIESSPNSLGCLTAADRSSPCRWFPPHRPLCTCSGSRCQAPRYLHCRSYVYALAHETNRSQLAQLWAILATPPQNLGL